MYNSHKIHTNNPHPQPYKWDTNQKSGIGKASFFKKGAEGAQIPIGTYHGTFVKGKRAGQGLFMYPNKDRYSGEWKNGQKHGKGTYIFQEPFLKMTRGLRIFCLGDLGYFL